MKTKTKRGSCRGIAVVLGVVAATCLTLPERVHGEADLSGDVTLKFTRILDSQGHTIGYTYGGAVANLTINGNIPITLNTSIDPLVANEPMLNWSNSLAWDNGLAIQLINSAVIAKAMYGDGTGEPSLSDNLDAINALGNTGPTERTISVSPLKITSPDIPGFEADFGAGVTFKFNVTIPSPAHVVMDQAEVILERLTVNPGASLTGGTGMIIRTDLVNHGFFGNLNGAVQRDFYNDGDPALGNRAEIVGQLTLQGQLCNSGEIRIGSGGLLNVNATTTNAGTIKLNGGGIAIGSAGLFTNTGNFQWSAGDIYDNGNGGLVNTSNSFIISNGGAKHIFCSQVVNNGTMVHTGNESVIVVGSAIPRASLVNQPGAVYDIQGDGGFVPYNGDNGGWIDNAGTFRKSGGTGTSTLGWISPNGDVAFNNSGTVEVSSGTLALKAGGSNSNGTFHFANGGRALIGGFFDIHGKITASGNGLLEVETGGRVRAVGGETATIEGFTDGPRFLLSSGGAYGDTGSTLVLNITGPGRVELAGGYIGGNGSTTNTGNFQWSAGDIYNKGLTNASDSFTITNGGGKRIFCSQLINSGTITHAGSESVVIVQSAIPGASLINQPGALYDIQGDGGFAPYNENSQVWIDNAGTFRKSGGTGTSTLGAIGNGAVAFNNTGTVEVLSGTLAFNGTFEQTAGASRLAGGALAFSTAQIEGGLLTGNGTVAGNVWSSGGVVSPGSSAGAITINGAYTQGASSSLLIELGGLADGQFDFLDVNGLASLGGRLEIAFLDSFWPQVGDTFRVLEYNSRSGTFADIDVLASTGYEFDALYGSTGMTLVTTAVPEPATVGLLLTGIALFLARRRSTTASRA